MNFDSFLPDVLRQVVSFFHFFLWYKIMITVENPIFFRKFPSTAVKTRFVFSFTLYHKPFGINRLILYLHQNKKEGAPEENGFQNMEKSIFFSRFFIKMFILSRMLSFYTENIYS